MMAGSVVLFGDSLGIPQLLEVIPPQLIRGLVRAGIRPNDHLQLQSLAEASEVSLLIQPKNTSSDYPAFVEQIRDLAPDLILVNSYSMLLRPELLAMPPHGAVNIHGALLPQYRGSNPIQWALLNNETETGVTMHYMSADFDTGDIIAQRRIPIYFEDTWRDIQTRIGAATTAMLREEIPKLLSHSNVRQPQDHTTARHYRRRHPEDGIIDWQQSVLAIYNLVRALVKPHPGAFYYQGSDKVVLDEYLSISRLTALKYDPSAGGQVLKSGEAVLTPVDVNDLPAMIHGTNDNQHLLLNTSNKSLASGHREWFDAIQKRNDVVIFGVRSRDTSKLIGSCLLQNIDYLHRRAELQIQLDEVGEDHRYVKAALNSLLNFAFKDLNLRRTYLHVFGNDQEAIGVYEKVGFKHEGLLREAAHTDDKNIDVAVMGILSDDYVAE